MTDDDDYDMTPLELIGDAAGYWIATWQRDRKLGYAPGHPQRLKNLFNEYLDDCYLYLEMPDEYGYPEPVDNPLPGM